MAIFPTLEEMQRDGVTLDEGLIRSLDDIEDDLNVSKYAKRDDLTLMEVETVKGPAHRWMKAQEAKQAEDVGAAKTVTIPGAQASEPEIKPIKSETPVAEKIDASTQAYIQELLSMPMPSDVVSEVYFNPSFRDNFSEYLGTGSRVDVCTYATRNSFLSPEDANKLSGVAVVGNVAKLNKPQFSIVLAKEPLPLQTVSDMSLQPIGATRGDVAIALAATLNVPLEFSKLGSAGHIETVIVTHNTYPGSLPWRTTRFEANFGATGHSESKTLREAVGDLIGMKFTELDSGATDRIFPTFPADADVEDILAGKTGQVGTPARKNAKREGLVLTETTITANGKNSVTHRWMRPEIAEAFVKEGRVKIVKPVEGAGKIVEAKPKTNIPGWHPSGAAPGSLSGEAGEVKAEEKETRLDATTFTRETHPKVFAAVEECENKTVSEAREYGSAIDMNGNVLFTAEGDDRSITLSPTELQKMKDAVFTHNHPGEGKNISLSLGDILCAAQADVLHERAVSKKWDKNMVYSVTRPKGGWPDLNNIRVAHQYGDSQSLASLHDQAMLTLAHESKQGRDFDAKGSDFQDAIWKMVFNVMAPDLGFNYKCEIV